MMKGLKIPGLIFILSWTNVFSQQVSHQVLVPLAGLSANGGINYSQTVGETAVEIISCSDYIFTQGFQQPLVKVSGETHPEGNGIKIYPNPVIDYVTIELYGESAKTFRVEFINLAGRVVRTSRFEFSDNFWFTEPQNIKDLLSGFYLVRIKSEDGMINRTFKIEKI
jgi:hypothetical protein